MIKVNLLPKDLRKRRKSAFVDKVLVYVILALIVEICSLYFVNWQQKNDIVSLKRDIELTNQEIKKYQPILKAYEEAIELRTKISVCMTAIQALETERPLWVRTLEELANVMSKNLWYKEIVYSGKTSKISIKSQSYSLIDIASFINNLEESTFFTNIGLGKVVQSKDQSITSYNFTTSMTLVKTKTRAGKAEFRIQKKVKPKKDPNLKPLDLKPKGKEALSAEKDKTRQSMEELAPK